DLRYDPTASARMAAEYTKENQQYLEKKVGDVDQADLYLAHFLGAGGATKFIKAMRADSDRPAADLFPQAARANKAVFYDHGRACSLAEIRDKFADKLKIYADASSEMPTTNSDTLLDSLYFPSLALAQAGPGSATGTDTGGGGGGGVGNWAFLRPTG